ncbi:MAG TPA: Rne/Rng family ribonuclease [Verrucomicrobiae bacterium]|nr:Rne/Rng family ribonuclease [Verrucomicrobiae bacterium]
MTKRLLIEATHPEETRVVVVDGKRLEEFDYETASKRQLKGNIYLAKVTRVEPSLQAAFVDYGGNRHGFLAFSEIHPDYYQIPVADREALLAEQAAMDADNDEFEDARPSRGRDRYRDRNRNSAAPAEIMPASDDAQDDGVHEHNEEPATEAPDLEASADDGEDEGGDEVPDDSGEDIAEAVTAEPDMASEDDELQGQALRISSPRLEGPIIEDSHEEHHEVAEIIEGTGEAHDETSAETAAESASPGAGGDGDGDGDAAEVSSDAGGVREAPRPPVVVETVGGDEAEEMRPRRTRHVRRYKIQEVIKRRQILLVQVTKEERGNKGAALTTYLSLAGRYCVLMPNTARGGGISRKINSVTDRKRLKSILGEMEIPDGMAVIVRTAGQERNKTELKRDYEYLLRLWDEIRELTLQSRAPALIYEEANLVKRAIRDMYARDVEEILVEGDESYKNAKNFMRMLMPSHAKRVQLFEDPAQHLFQKFQVEGQIDAIHNPVVQLRSGGYIVINTTEALVAIDVNSGRSTRERNIEETALRTNLEAAEEVARQLRLRDLAGLIVIDFIDMEESRNNAAVERKLKEALRNDRARIQVGRISPFGLLELSRQRLRPSLFEASMVTCRHCRGTGHVRSTESTALYMLRAIEDEGLKQRSTGVTVTVPTAVALYILNNKRAALAEIEVRHHMRVVIAADESLVPPEHRMERSKTPIPVPEAKVTVSLPEMPLEDEEEIEVEVAEESSEPAVAEEGTPEPMAARAPSDEQGNRRGRRRRRRGRGRDGQRDGPRDGQRGGDEGQRHQPRDENRHAAAPEDGAGDSGENEEADEFEPHGDGDQAPSEGGASRDAGPPGENGERRRRRRGRRGGRRRRRGGERFGDSAEGANGQEPRHESVSGQDPAADDRMPERHGEADISDSAPQHSIERVEPAESRMQFSPPPELRRTEELPPKAIDTPAPRARGTDNDDDQPEISGAPSTSEPPRRGWWKRLIE